MSEEEQAITDMARRLIGVLNLPDSGGLTWGYGGIHRWRWATSQPKPTLSNTWKMPEEFGDLPVSVLPPWPSKIPHWIGK